MTSSRSSLHFSKMFKDRPVQVAAGRERTIYHVHPGVLSSCSATFKARTSEPWMNGASEVIDWTDFDEKTVECVLSYLYSEDYDVREAASIGEATYITQSTESDHDHDLNPTDSMRPESPPSVPAELDGPFEERPLTPLSQCISVGLPAESTETAAATFSQTALHDCDELLGNTALMHAKVYCFAHRFLISRLEELALQRLTQVLLTCDSLSNAFFSRLTDAIRLVYESTPNATQVDDPARQLLSQYVALNYTSLPDESLSTLASEGGEFMADVAQKLARRIAADGRTSQSLEGQIDKLKIKVTKVEKEIKEWENWNLSLPRNHRRARGGVLGASPFEWGVSSN